MRNTLFHIRRNSPLAEKFSLTDLIYLTCLSSVDKEYDEDEKVTYAIFSKGMDMLESYFQDWEEQEVTDALDELGQQNLLLFDEDTIYVGTFEGKRFEPFSSKDSSIYQKAVDLIEKGVSSSKNILPKARYLYIKNRLKLLIEKHTDDLSVNDLVELHGLLYEIYTGGENYSFRNKTEVYQIPNILKAYDKASTFSIIAEAVLNYDLYHKKGLPTLINVAMMKDDCFKHLCKKDTSTKEYMREEASEEENEF